MNELPKDGKPVGVKNSFAGANSGRLERILNAENPIIPLSAKDKVRLACFAGREEELKAGLRARISDKQLSLGEIQKRSYEFFEKGFGVGKSTEIKPDSVENYTRRLAILENLYGKDVYSGREISDNMEKYQLSNIFDAALIEIATGNIK